MEQLLLEWENFDVLGIHLETIDHVNHVFDVNHEQHNEVVQRADDNLKSIIDKMDKLDY